MLVGSGQRLICEIQFHVGPYLELKDASHPAYELCRSLMLVGPLPTNRLAIVHNKKKEAGKGALSIMILSLRYVAGSLALLFAFMYLYYYLLDSLVRREPNITGLPERQLPMWSWCLSTPYFVVAFLLFRDILEKAPCAFKALHVFGTAIIALSGSITIFVADASVKMTYLGMTAIYLVAYGSFVGCVWIAPRCCQKSSSAPVTGNRVSLLYDRHFGLNGDMFIWKVTLLQFSTVLLQATGKLQIMGAAASLEGRSSAGVFWLFLSVMLINAIYPSLFLRAKTVHVQRDAVAIVDAALDLVYSLVVLWSLWVCRAPISGLPSDFLAYTSNFFPVFHIFTVARSIETAKVQRDESFFMKTHQSTLHAPSAGESKAHWGRLPRPVGVGYAVLSYSAIAFILWSRCYGNGTTDRVYPFRPLNMNGCAPCRCSSTGVLKTCDRDMLKIVTPNELYLVGKEITNIELGAFAELNMFFEVELDDNELVEIQSGMVSSSLPWNFLHRATRYER